MSGDARSVTRRAAAGRAPNARRKTQKYRLRAVVLVGLGVALVAAVLSFASGVVFAGYVAIGLGVVWLVVAVRQARPSRWAPAEVEHGVRGRDG